MENKKNEKCVHCVKRKVEDDSQEEVNFAVLLALVPLIVLTFFNQINLI
jgi:hypothetical protein